MLEVPGFHENHQLIEKLDIIKKILRHSLKHTGSSLRSMVQLPS